MTLLGIVAALPSEQKALTRARIKTGCCQRISANTLVCLSGMGPHKAEQATTLLVGKGCGAVISWGCGAALDNSLKPGDLVLPQQVITAEGETLVASESWRVYLVKKLSAIENIHPGPLIESPVVVYRAEEKADLANRTCAAAVDMESAAVARVCCRQRLPFVAIRVIVDPASMTLPESLRVAMDASGNLSIARLLRYTAAHPSNLGGLIQLGRYYGAAQRKLQTVAQTLGNNFLPAR